jgi:hypothetical protein
MKISKKSPILGLKKVISRLFDVKLDNFDLVKYHPKLPYALKELYEMDAFYAKHDCAFETIRFFANQDRLVSYQDLKLAESPFTFVRENQNNWLCQTDLDSNKVYFNDGVEPQKSRFLPHSMDAFLTTFALQEIGFNLKFYFGLKYQNMDEIKAHFKKFEPLWTDKNYIYGGSFDYYLVDDDCLVMYAGMNIFATNDEAKFQYYKSILKHYTF